MDIVLAKFRCISKTNAPDDTYAVFTFTPSYDDSNAQWSKYTPSGSLSMTITKEGAMNSFEVDKEFYLTFSLADNDQRITISLKEYRELQLSRDRLGRLEAAGVDNWDGYSYAFTDKEYEEYEK